MSKPPDWLPKALRYEDFKGDWDKFLETVYSIFERDFKKTRPKYDGRPITYDSKIENGKEAAFWHVTSSVDLVTGDRVPDIKRCERIPWPRPIIEHPSDKAISVWKVKQRRESRVLLWLEELDYLVVLAEKPRAVVLVTAYCTDREHTRVKLQKERDKYLRKQKPPRGAT
jgi:hypothetical protein